jgi:hypothetical protein
VNAKKYVTGGALVNTIKNLSRKSLVEVARTVLIVKLFRKSEFAEHYIRLM